MPHKPRKPSRADVDRIVQAECARLGVDPNLVMSGAPRWGMRRIRGLIWDKIVKETGCSASGLARAWGGDPSTVHHAIRAVRALEAAETGAN